MNLGHIPSSLAMPGPSMRGNGIFELAGAPPVWMLAHTCRPGHAQPTAEALKKLALALHVTSDALLFEEGEREPDDDLKLRFEAIAAMLPAEQEVAKAVLDAIIVKSQVTGALARVNTPAAKEKS